VIDVDLVVDRHLADRAHLPDEVHLRMNASAGTSGDQQLVKLVLDASQSFCDNRES
jgi:hypothetical protein